jgi:hypothetical protein
MRKRLDEARTALGPNQWAVVAEQAGGTADRPTPSVTPAAEDAPAPVLPDPSESSEWLPEELATAYNDQTAPPPADPSRWVPQALR